MNEFNPLQTIKRRFFAMRNGVIADTLRRAGSPFKIIFGLNLPQLVEIAAETGFNMELAKLLWSNTTTRESMLLAPMLIDPDNLPQDKALEMIDSVPAVEVADVLCHRLLRHADYAYPMACCLATSPNPMSRYCSMRILWHFLNSHADEIYDMACREIECADSLTLAPARQIKDEIDFIREEV